MYIRPFHPLFYHPILSSQVAIYPSKYNFICMNSKRMSLTLQPRCPVRQQMDQLLQADYQMLNDHQQEQQAVLRCHLANNNRIIHQYIQVVQNDYNCPSPLHRPPSKVSSKKKLELSILSASKQHHDLVGNERNRKKLTLTAKKSSNQSSQQQINQGSRQNTIMMTPKFFHWEQDSDRPHSGQLLLEQSNGKPYNPPANTLNRIASKEKPIHFGREGHGSTAKKGGVEESQVSHHNFESRVTIKRAEGPSSSLEDSYAQGDDFIHKNPIISKMHKKNLDEYCRPGRIATSIIQQPAKKLKIKESYRYCIGCQLPILENNIRPHEKQCSPFQQISALSSNREVLRVVRQKIAAIQSRIPARNSQIEQQHATVVRNKSASLVKESRRREERSPESANFRKDYESIMEIGKKWCSSMEEVNKLRWFTRIALKLEDLVAHEQQ